MHARFYNPQLGRFLSTDRANDWDPKLPQTWNRYTYARANPLKYVDPDGHAVRVATQGEFNAARDEILLPLTSVPVIGFALSAAVDEFVLPKTQQEANSAALTQFGTVGLSAASGAAKSLGTALTSALTRAERLAANRLRGNAFRDALAGALRAEGREVATEVSKWTPFGRRFIDIEVRHEGRLLGGIETKTGNSLYTASQRVKDWWLRTFQGYEVQLVRHTP
jgi:hypothetical protein